MKVLFVYPRFERHAQSHPELLETVPMSSYLGSPSLGIACLAAVTPPDWEVEFRDDRQRPADGATDADLVALSFFTPAATRAFELAKAFRAMGKKVVAGGIFPTMMPDEVAPHVDAVIVGEGDTVWPQLLRDAEAGELKPQYRATASVDLNTLPVPDLSVYFNIEDDRYRPDDYPLQTSRGCPLKCHACVLPVSMTKQLRAYPLAHIIAQLDQLEAAGKRACLTEDTSWLPGQPSRAVLEQLLAHLIATGRTASISYIGTSIPMLRLSRAKMLTNARLAGIDMTYLVCGFDPWTIRAFGREAEPRVRQQALDAVARSWDAGIEPYASFLIGGDTDDLGTVDRILEFANEAGIRKAEFAIATPYPGTPQYEQFEAEGRILTRHWARYNDANVVFQPKWMTPDELTGGYLRLWKEFYADRASVVGGLSATERIIQV